MAEQTNERTLVWRRMHISLHDIFAYVGYSPEYLRAVKAAADGRGTSTPLALKNDPTVRVPARILTPYGVLCVTEEQLIEVSRIGQTLRRIMGAKVWMSGDLLCIAWPDDAAPRYIDWQGRQV
jgi:hypothetical protein